MYDSHSFSSPGSIELRPPDFCAPRTGVSSRTNTAEARKRRGRINDRPPNAKRTRKQRKRVYPGIRAPGPGRLLEDTFRHLDVDADLLVHQLRDHDVAGDARQLVRSQL